MIRIIIMSKKYYWCDEVSDLFAIIGNWEFSEFNSVSFRRPDNLLKTLSPGVSFHFENWIFQIKRDLVACGKTVNKDDATLMMSWLVFVFVFVFVLTCSSPEKHQNSRSISWFPNKQSFSSEPSWQSCLRRYHDDEIPNK